MFTDSGQAWVFVIGVIVGSIIWLIIQYFIIRQAVGAALVRNDSLRRFERERADTEARRQSRRNESES